MVSVAGTPIAPTYGEKRARLTTLNESKGKCNNTRNTVNNYNKSAKAHSTTATRSANMNEREK